MINLDIGNLRGSTDSLFRFAVLAAKRAQELSQGSPRLIDVHPNTKVTTIALMEIAENKVSYREAPKK